ncbi:MAG: hypothetical protein QXU86_06310 [Metallosphaera sp.]
MSDGVLMLFLGLKPGSKVHLDQALLSVEQLPQMAKILNLSLEWENNLNLHGPDGSEVRVHGRGNVLEATSPLLQGFMPWSFDPLNSESLKSLTKDLIPCEEGEGYINPSPWERVIDDQRKVTLGPGEIGPGKVEERTDLAENLDTNMFNGFFYHLNPFYISALGLRDFVSIKTHMLSIQGYSTSYTLVSAKPFLATFQNGKVKLDGEALVIKTKMWKEAKPHRLLWNSINPVISLDCKPKYKVSLIKIEPSSVVPLHLEYRGILEIGLINMDDKPVVSTVYLPARISRASVTDPRDMSDENLEPEFDRVRVPIRRWGIILLKLEVKKLLEGLLKKKIIST